VIVFEVKIRHSAFMNSSNSQNQISNLHFIAKMQIIEVKNVIKALTKIQCENNENSEKNNFSCKLTREGDLHRHAEVLGDWEE